MQWMIMSPTMTGPWFTTNADEEAGPDSNCVKAGSLVCMAVFVKRSFGFCYVVATWIVEQFFVQCVRRFFEAGRVALTGASHLSDRLFG
jgi:hypothetical protein